MRYLSSYPGAYPFRLIMIVIIMSTLILLFFRYTNKISIATEKASIQQTRTVINSALAVVFATHAVQGKLDRLNEYDGGNPFTQLAKFNVSPANYRGEVSVENLGDIGPGWYYDKASRQVIYKPYYDERVYYFTQVLEYRDVNQSGQFESAVDEYQRLLFRQLPRQ